MKFGLIGDGRIAKRHKKAVNSIGGNISWIYDPIHKEVDTTPDGYKIIHYLSKENFMLVDYAIICSPTFLHYNHIKIALQYDVKIIVEKPMVLPW